MRPAMLEKQKTIDHIINQINDAKATIIVHYQGLNVANFSYLRKELKAQGAIIKIYKNNLVARALQKSKFQALENNLVGPNAFVFGFEDDLVTAKIVANYAKINKMITFKGGIFDGKVVDQNQLIAIAALPSKLELIAMLAATIQTPILHLALVLKKIAQQKANA